MRLKRDQCGRQMQRRNFGAEAMRGLYRVRAAASLCVAMTCAGHAHGQTRGVKPHVELACVLTPPFEWRNQRFIELASSSIAASIKEAWPEAKIITLVGRVDNDRWTQVNQSLGCDRRREGALNVFLDLYVTKSDQSYTIGVAAEWADGSAHGYRSRQDWEKLYYLSPPPIDSLRPAHDAAGIIPYAVDYDARSIWNEIAPQLGIAAVRIPTGWQRFESLRSH